MAHPHAKAMPETQPLLFDQDLETPQSPIILVHHQHRQRSQLRRPIPAVAAVHQNARPMLVNVPKDLHTMFN
jgi:hypothetical protein